MDFWTDYGTFRRLRDRAGLTLEEIAQKTRVTLQRLQDFEAGLQRLNARERSSAWRVVALGIREKLGTVGPVAESAEVKRLLASMPEPKLPVMPDYEPAAAGFAILDEDLKAKRSKRKSRG